MPLCALGGAPYSAIATCFALRFHVSLRLLLARFSRFSLFLCLFSAFVGADIFGHFAINYGLDVARACAPVLQAYRAESLDSILLISRAFSCRSFNVPALVLAHCDWASYFCCVLALGRVCVPTRCRFWVLLPYACQLHSCCSLLLSSLLCACSFALRLGFATAAASILSLSVAFAYARLVRAWASSPYCT